MNINERYRGVLKFWFGEDVKNKPFDKQKNWWIKEGSFDALIREKFEKTYDQARSGLLNEWQSQPEKCLALVIVLDQFSRNLFRESPKAFEQDEKAQQICLKALTQKFDEALVPVEAGFLYMPLMHAESQDMQKLCIQKFAKLYEDTGEAIFKGNLDFAIKHAEIIDRFGRFPHRNQVLGRKSTQEEVEFLKEPNSSF